MLDPLQNTQFSFKFFHALLCLLEELATTDSLSGVHFVAQCTVLMTLSPMPNPPYPKATEDLKRNLAIVKMSVLAFLTFLQIKRIGDDSAL